jgi:hypothetical protein
MLEKAGASSDDLKKLKESIGETNTYIGFNPFIRSRIGNINKDWKIILNG